MKRREKRDAPTNEVDNAEQEITPAYLIRLRQLGDRGLLAAIQALATKDNQPTN